MTHLAQRVRPKLRAAWLLMAVTLGCQREREQSSAEPSSALTARPSKAVPVDRLAPNELSAGNAEVWGFAVPREMQVEHRLSDVAHLVGPVKPDALANNVRDRVLGSHVESGAARTVFPNARIKAGARDRVYEFDVIPGPGMTQLVIRDTTPPPVTPGLSDAQRWQQAGLTPEGRPIDPKQFE